jgi:hypothetical protein
MSVSIPYATTDAVGNTTSTVFQSPPQKIYGPLKITAVPIAVEVGRERWAFNMGFSVPFTDAFTGGYWLTSGYGRNFFLSGWRHHQAGPSKRPFVIKVTVNLLYDWDLGANAAGTFGSIDNTSKIIHLMGLSIDSVFTSHGGRYSETYPAKDCGFHFAQRELALMPRIILSNSPFVSKARFELILGYTIPLVDRGGIYITQDTKESNYSQGVCRPLDLAHYGATVVYNNEVIGKTPFRFGGFFLGCAFSVGSAWYQEKK